MVSTSLAATCSENSYCDRSNTNSDNKTRDYRWDANLDSQVYGVLTIMHELLLVWYTIICTDQYT